MAGSNARNPGFEKSLGDSSVLDDLKTLENVDRGGMRMMISYFPTLVRRALELSDNIVLPGNYKGFNEIVVCGMGGSAIGGDLFCDLSRRTIPVEVSVVRDYDLPRHVGEKSLVIAVSYSGNTEETLEAFKQAYARGCRIVAIASNGPLEKACSSLNIPLLKIPSGFQPRAALPLLFIPLLAIAEKTGFPVVEKSVLLKVCSLTEEYNSKLEPKSPLERNPAKQLAAALLGKLPVIYSFGHLKSVALRYKDQINENSKLRAMFDQLPELNHNEVEAWEKADFKELLHVILIDSGFKNPYIAESIRLLASKVSSAGVGISIIHPLGVTMIEEMLTAIIFGDWVSYYLAILRGVDPTPVSLISELKKKREEKLGHFTGFEEWLSSVK